MSRRFEPYVVIHVLGVPLGGDDRAAYADFLNFLLQQGVSFYWGKFRDDVIGALHEGFRQDERASLFGNAYVDVGLTFPNLPVQLAGLWLGTWHKEQTRSLRINLFGNDEISHADFDSLGEYLADLALRFHQKLGAMVTVMESSERALAPYNTKTMPLWVGWHAVYGEAVQRKYHVQEATAFPAGITMTRVNSDLVVRHSMPFSEHILKGWGSEQHSFWKTMGGRVLRKPGAYKLSPKDGETFIVDEVDEKGDIVHLSPLEP